MADQKPIIWLRLEPRTRRSDRVGQHLAARIWDPLWMLTRQRQAGEFRGADGGTPVLFRMEGHTFPLRGLVGIGQKPVALGGQVPERELLGERFAPTLGDRARLGMELLERLRDRLGSGVEVETKLDALVSRWKIEPAAGAACSVGDQRSQELLEWALDGWRAYESQDAVAAWLRKNFREDAVAVEKALTVWDGWVRSVQRRYGPAIDKTSRWKATEMRQYAGLSTLPSTANSADFLRFESLPTADGESLGWSTFRQVDTAEPVVGTAQNTSLSQEAIPRRLSFPGMPAPRWWDFEDASTSLVDLGGLLEEQETEKANGLGEREIALAPYHWLSFILTASHNWFVAPLTVPRGVLLQLSSVKVVDVFGVEKELPAFDAYVLKGGQPVGMERASVFRTTQVPDRNRGGWRTDPTQPPKSPELGEYLLVPPSSGYTIMDGPILEELAIRLDESANVLWGVVETVEDAWGRPVGGADFRFQRAQEGDETPVSPLAELPPDGPISYRPRSPVPANYHPLLPTSEGYQMARLWTEGGSVAEVPGRLLQELHAEGGQLRGVSVGPSGMTVRRRLRRGRSADGQTWTWVERTVVPGSRAARSNLRFDVPTAGASLSDSSSNSSPKSGEHT